MKTLILVLAFGLMVGCGKPGTVTSHVDPWSQHDINTALYGCTLTASTGIPTSPASSLAAAETIVDVYCNCMIQEAQKRWSAAEFGSNSADAQALISDGTQAKCTAKAQE